MNNQTQLELNLQPHTPHQDELTPTQRALQARATLYQIQVDNLRKEADQLHARIAHLDAMVAYFSHKH